MIQDKSFLKVLGKWILYGGIIGGIVGSTTAFLLETNDYLGEIREKNDWLIYLLPLGGIVIGYIYMNYGKVVLNNTLNDTAQLNNLVIDAVNGEKKVPQRMGPIVYLGTFITVFLADRPVEKGQLSKWGAVWLNWSTSYLRSVC